MLSALFATMPMGVVVHGADGQVVSANASALAVLGLSLEEISGKTSMDPDWQAVREDGSPFPGEQHPAMVCLATGEPVREAVMGVTSQSSHERRWLRVHANPLRVGGVLAGAYACFEDITERRHTEARLAEAGEQLELALAGANLGTYDAHLPSGRVAVNVRYLELLGYAPGELQMSVTEWMNRIHPDDLPRIRTHYDLIVARSGKFVDIEYRLRHKAGHWVWLHDRGRIFETDAANHPVRVAGTQLDISHRKQAELDLLASEARFRTIVETAPDAILIFVDHRAAMANPACVRLFGANTEEDLLGRDLWSLSSPRSHTLLRQRVERALLSGAVNPVAEVELLRLDGTPFSVDGVSVAIEYQGRPAVHVMMRDATPRKQAETLLRQHREEMERAQSLQVAQQTVAGIAHELNQPLNAISTLAEAARRLAEGLQPLPPPLAEALQGIARGTQRAGRVVHELMDFLRSPNLSLTEVDLATLLKEAVAHCRASLPFAGEVEMHLPLDLPQVAGNAMQIEKIVGNLLRNAVEAFQSADRAGRVTIRTIVEGRRVSVLVEDNGPGVAAELLPRLFQPFVSNKPGGIGMGLPISQSLARSMGGDLEYQPAPGNGARFHLSLPIIAGDTSGNQP